jgi:hypothetical protein
MCYISRYPDRHLGQASLALIHNVDTATCVIYLIVHLITIRNAKILKTDLIKQTFIETQISQRVKQRTELKATKLILFCGRITFIFVMRNRYRTSSDPWNVAGRYI